MDAHVVRPGAQPGHEAPGQIRRVQRPVGQQALGQRQGHLGVVGEAAGRDASRPHLAYQASSGLAGAELQRHAQRIAHGRAHGAALDAVHHFGIHALTTPHQPRLAARSLSQPMPWEAPSRRNLMSVE